MINYRCLSDQEVIALAETLEFIPQALSQELLHRLRRAQSGQGERKGDVIIATHWFTRTTNPGEKYVWIEI